MRADRPASAQSATGAGDPRPAGGAPAGQGSAAAPWAILLIRAPTTWSAAGTPGWASRRPGWCQPGATDLWLQCLAMRAVLHLVKPQVRILS